MGRFQIKTAVRKEDIHMTAPPGKPFLPFWMPGEEPPPDSSANVRPMASKTLVNILNYLHFSDRSLFAHVWCIR
ncbi:MAG: hypothetical protein B1H13_10240 [Desulfobacteraceae bacterium 4484_190.3]|nr:MAG: hypothetical protein B1H13_10240 [Desulfobacteraceae bacterium 4484_190.3]